MDWEILATAGEQFFQRKICCHFIGVICFTVLTVTSEFKQCLGKSRHKAAGTGRFRVCFYSNRGSSTPAQSIWVCFPVTLFLRNNCFSFFFFKYSHKNGNSIKAVFFYMKVRGRGNHKTIWKSIKCFICPAKKGTVYFLN